MDIHEIVNVATEAISGDKLILDREVSAGVWEGFQIDRDKIVPGTILWKGQLVQTSTNAPVITEYVNIAGLTVTSAYGGVGSYTLLGFNSLLTGNIEVTFSRNIPADEDITVQVATNSILLVETYNSFGTVSADDIIDANFNVITVTAY